MKGRCVGDTPCPRPARGQIVITTNTSSIEGHAVICNSIKVSVADLISSVEFELQQWDVRGVGAIQISLRSSNICITAGVQQSDQRVGLQLDKCAGSYSLSPDRKVDRIHHCCL